MPADTPTDWTAPGPGTWELDTAHVEPTVSRLARDVLSEGAGAGLSTGFELMGAPLASVAARFVNGGYYLRLVPLVGGDRDLPDPPAPVLWALTRLHPAFRRRAKRSVEALESRVWISEFDRWTSEWKPELVDANRSFGEVDVSALDDHGLADHLDALWAHLRTSTALHFRLHCSDLGPIGRLLVRSEEWGLDRRRLMSALAGSSPSTSAPAVALAGIRSALDDAGVVPTTLDDIRSAGGEAERRLVAYLGDYGPRLTTGYDIRDLTLEELPDLVLASILDARDLGDVAAAAARQGEAAFDELRARVPESERDEFDLLVADARLLYGLRDENGPLTYEWPAGLMRRTVLEAARRLASSGRISEAEHLFDASAGEMSSILRGRNVPSADELGDRCAERMSWASLTPPAVLGRPASEPPVDVLPGQMPLLMRAVLTVMDLLEGDPDDDALSGTGVGTEAYRGVARVVASADEAFDRIEPGDILVTRLTVPTYNSVLAMAGGVVTENGGLLCHTAVIARELGIPAVVGVRGALELPDGAEIEIDPVAGRVTVVG